MPDSIHSALFDRNTGEALPGKIIYANPDVSGYHIKPYSGRSYPDRIPDTYDVASRAMLGVNALTGATNPLADHELYWKVDFARNPVVMNHDWNDWCQVKFMEALPLLRLVSGSQQAQEVDWVWQNVTLKSLGSDGLFYEPMHGRPWAWQSSCWAEGVARADGSLAALKDPDVTQVTHPFINSRMIGTLLVYWLHDDNPFWINVMHRIVDRLAELAIYKDDYAFYPAYVFEPGAVYAQDAPQAALHNHLLGGEINARLPESLGKLYRLTGYEPARQLGEKLVCFVKNQMDYYSPSGEFIAERHFHAHTIYLLSLLEFAVATGDQDTLAFVRRGYEWAKSPASGAVDLIGYFPEVADPSWPSAESCTIADMVSLALRLTVAGMGDYYADAERWVRNHFAEAQLTDAAWVNDQAQLQPVRRIAPNETGNHTAERNVGAFAQGSGGNEFWVKGPDGIVHCCTGNGARTLYYIWKEILQFDDGLLRVNLLLNRASAWADVYSYIPNRGQVDIQLKVYCREVRVHAPAWITPGDLTLVATINDHPSHLHWDANYLVCGPATAGSRISLTFHISEYSEHVVVSLKHYDLVIRGDTVVKIDPPGQTGALYQRDHFRQSEPRWLDVTRFVPDEFPDY